MEIRTIQDGEIDGAQSLIPERWNADIRHLVMRHRGSPSFYPLIAIDNSTVMAYGQAFVFDKTAWLGNIIVESGYRRKGIGQALTQELVRYSFEKRVSTIHLAATEMGEPMYRKLGFMTDTLFLHYNGSSKGQVCRHIRPMSSADRDTVLDISYRVTGEARDSLLLEHLAEGHVYYRGGEITGFFLPGFGNGMVLALDDEAGRELLRFKHRDPLASSVLSEENEAGIDFLESMKLSGRKASTRMYLGEYTPWYPERTFSRGTSYTG